LALGTQPSGVKGALEILGESIGPCRSPVGPLTPASQQKMRAALLQAGLLAK
jgi:dihydrodipicolinate synthase/N-acetylneuraminate lyase